MYAVPLSLSLSLCLRHAQHLEATVVGGDSGRESGGMGEKRRPGDTVEPGELRAIRERLSILLSA